MNRENNRLAFGSALLVLCVTAACGGGTDKSPAASATVTPTPTTASLSGSVSVVGGQRVPNATVRIFDGANAGRSTTANASGEYSLDNLQVGNANVVASTFIHGEVVTGRFLSGPTAVDFVLPTPACQTNGTGWMTVGNRSATATHEVSWDGVRIATLAPGQNSPEFAVTAGVPHTLVTRIAGTTRLACSQANPIVAQCDRAGLTCAGS